MNYSNNSVLVMSSIFLLFILLNGCAGETSKQINQVLLHPLENDNIFIESLVKDSLFLATYSIEPNDTLNEEFGYTEYYIDDSVRFFPDYALPFNDAVDISKQVSNANPVELLQYQDALLRFMLFNNPQDTTSFSLFEHDNSFSIVPVDSLQSGGNTSLYFLFENGDITLEKLKVYENQFGTLTAESNLRGEDGNEALFVVDGNQIYGTFLLDGQTHVIRHLVNGIHAEYILYEQLPPEDSNDFDVRPGDSTITVTDQSNLLGGNSIFYDSDFYRSNSVVPIRVLFVYSDAVYFKRNFPIKKWIQVVIETANSTFIESNLSARIELAHAYRTRSFSVTNNIDADVIRLMNNSYIKTLRQNSKADVVVLLHETNSRGVAASIEAPIDSAYAVVDYRAANNTNTYTLAHEIGHIIGARHHCGSDSSQPYEDGHGFVQANKRWGTVMSDCIIKHNCDRRKKMWSRPNLEGERSPIPNCSHNNVRIIESNYRRVANFFSSPPV